MVSRLFLAHGEFCTNHPWEVIVATLTLTACMFTVERQNPIPATKPIIKSCQGCIQEVSFLHPNLSFTWWYLMIATEPEKNTLLIIQFIILVWNNCRTVSRPNYLCTTSSPFSLYLIYGWFCGTWVCKIRPWCQ